MRTLKLLLIFIFCFAIYGFAEEKSLLIDNLDGPIHTGAEATVDYGAGNGSSVEVSSDTHIKYFDKQSLKVVYDAVAGGYMWVARGFGLDAQKAVWLKKPEEIDWKAYNCISFYMYGSNSKVRVAFDVKDSGNEMFRQVTTDDFNGWKQIVLQFKDFKPREDWQPANANKNANIDFPIKSYQFEPLPESKGTLYFDRVELINR
ncbi:MAG: carbohydrate binding domain-containing protein [Candidatus Omnitrophota bacterium]|nr:carbohydrate binding domain-containing protein [Candidatus Omnitrophota bacterium]